MLSSEHDLSLQLKNVIPESYSQSWEGSFNLSMVFYCKTLGKWLEWSPRSHHGGSVRKDQLGRQAPCLYASWMPCYPSSPVSASTGLNDAEQMELPQLALFTFKTIVKMNLFTNSFSEKKMCYSEENLTNLFRHIWMKI